MAAVDVWEESALRIIYAQCINISLFLRWSKRHGLEKMVSIGGWDVVRMEKRVWRRKIDRDRRKGKMQDCKERGRAGVLNTNGCLQPGPPLLSTGNDCRTLSSSNENDFQFPAHCIDCVFIFIKWIRVVSLSPSQVWKRGRGAGGERHSQLHCVWYCVSACVIHVYPSENHTLF